MASIRETSECSWTPTLQKKITRTRGIIITLFALTVIASLVAFPAVGVGGAALIGSKWSLLQPLYSAITSTHAWLPYALLVLPWIPPVAMSPLCLILYKAYPKSRPSAPLPFEAVTASQVNSEFQSDSSESKSTIKINHLQFYLSNDVSKSLANRKPANTSIPCYFIFNDPAMDLRTDDIYPSFLYSKETGKWEESRNSVASLNKELQQGLVQVITLKDDVRLVREVEFIDQIRDDLRSWNFDEFTKYLAGKQPLNAEAVFDFVIKDDENPGSFIIAHYTEELSWEIKRTSSLKELEGNEGNVIFMLDDERLIDTKDPVPSLVLTSLKSYSEEEIRKLKKQHLDYAVEGDPEDYVKSYLKDYLFVFKAALDTSDCKQGNFLVYRYLPAARGLCRMCEPICAFSALEDMLKENDFRDLTVITDMDLALKQLRS